MTFFQLITGKVAEANKPKLRETAERHIRSYIQDHRMAAFAEAQIVPDFGEGAVAVAQAHGIGPLESNTALMGWSGTPGGRVLLMDLVRSFSDLHKSVLFLRMDETKGFGQQRRIHVWWGGRGGNGDLMLLLAYLLTQHRFWDDAEICIHRIVDSKEAIAATRAHTEALLDAVRVEANVVIIVRKPPGSPDRLPVLDLIARNSVNADLTFLGMPRPADGASEAAAERLDQLAQAVGTAVLVHNGQDQEGLLEGE